jgi:hypothetical protein
MLIKQQHYLPVWRPLRHSCGPSIGQCHRPRPRPRRRWQLAKRLRPVPFSPSITTKRLLRSRLKLLLPLWPPTCPVRVAFAVVDVVQQTCTIPTPWGHPLSLEPQFLVLPLELLFLLLLLLLLLCRPQRLALGPRRTVCAKGAIAPQPTPNNARVSVQFLFSCQFITLPRQDGSVLNCASDTFKYMGCVAS